MRKYLFTMSFIGLAMVWSVCCWAQNSGTEEPSPGMSRFKKTLKEYTTLVKEVGNLQQKFLSTAVPEEEKEAIGVRLAEISEEVGEVHPRLVKLAERAWLEQPSEDPELLTFIVQVLEIRLMEDDYEAVYALLKGLLSGRIPQILPDVYDVAGETCFMLNQFEASERFYAKAEKEEVISEKGEALRKAIPYHRVAWAKEKRLRDQEAAANDLPRVKLETSQGDIVLELYENEAPNTVANFIYLVEKGFYEGTEFFSVVPGLFAEGGRSPMTADGGPGYQIKDELEHRNARKHFRGTISMTRSEPDSAGSQFFISFAPAKEMDGEFVVFGRIVDGMDVLTKLQRIDPANPDPAAMSDTIVAAEVIRKREHVYRPKIIKPKKEKDSSQTKKTDKKTGAYEE